ncbi:MAG: Clp protease N-terminal domain-containing protein [Pseudonocardia sp.]
MPKVEVYLSDDLAARVERNRLQVSVICQQALEQALRRIDTVRAAAAGTTEVLAAAADPPPFTARAQTVLLAARERGRAADPPAVSTGHLLAAILSTGPSLAHHVLGAMDVDVAELGDELAGRPAAEAAAAEAQDEGHRPDGATALSGPARTALLLARAEAASFGHNFIGCEHLLLGLSAEPDGRAGRVLRERGVEHAALRRTIAAAVAVHDRARSH